MRYIFIISLVLSSLAATAQMQAGSKRDSIAQSKIIELVENEHLLPYYDENRHTPGDFIYSSHIATILKQRPDPEHDEYWIQVTDHRMYEQPNVYFNFFVDPKTWAVYVYDIKTEKFWTWENWKRQPNYRSPNYSPLYYPNI